MHNDDVMASIVSVLPQLQLAITVGDYVKYRDRLHQDGLGEVVGISPSAGLMVKKFSILSSDVLKKYSLLPLNAVHYPLSCQDELVEVYQTKDSEYIERSCVTDVVFIVPVQEVESGRFFLSGAGNVFVIRFLNDGRLGMIPWMESFYFSRLVTEPISIRLFHAMNTLSDHIRRSLFHRPESVTTMQSFKLPLFSGEAFWYLLYKVYSECISCISYRKQRTIKYYCSLKMESVVKQSTFIYLRVLSKAGLDSLQQCLGKGIRLGLSVRRPTKSQPIGFCRITSTITSIECMDIAPVEAVANPRIKCLANGIDLIFSEENRILSGHIRFQKIVVNNAADVTSRLPMAFVGGIQSAVHVEAMFYYNEILYEVCEINTSQNLVKSTAVQDFDVADITLPLEVVQNLVSIFGR